MNIYLKNIYGDRISDWLMYMREIQEKFSYNFFRSQRYISSPINIRGFLIIDFVGSRFNPLEAVSQHNFRDLVASHLAMFLTSIRKYPEFKIDEQWKYLSLLLVLFYWKTFLLIRLIIFKRLKQKIYSKNTIWSSYLFAKDIQPIGYYIILCLFLYYWHFLSTLKWRRR